MKKFLAILLSVMLLATLLVGCGGADEGTDAEAPEQAEEGADQEAEAPADDGEKPYIAIVSKGFQHQFWQVVLKGAEDAAKEFNVDITFEGPPSESDISEQVDMLNNALAKKPDAVCLAALDTESVMSQLEETKEKGIPVIGFDSGVPDAPEGSIVSTASTNNYEAGKLAAEEMFNHPDFNEKVKAATADNPVAIAVQSQDATSASILDRTNGFIDGMKEKCEELFPGGVEVTGHDVFAEAASDDVVVSLKVTVPPSTSYTDAQAAAQTMLSNTENLIGYYMSNEASVTG
ncbi:MAG: substrate-binding domain-containing protein, partial [Clostridia bacterium]|nr:substrate-binding domain-containing protein [Clostridia bacterium]